MEKEKVSIHIMKQEEDLISSLKSSLSNEFDITINVLNAERELYSDLRDYAEGRYNYVRSILKLEQSAGALGFEDVERVNAWLTEP